MHKIRIALLPSTAARRIAWSVALLIAALAVVPRAAAAEADSESAETPVRNVVLIIADGMGAAQVGLLEAYARYAPASPYQGPTALRRFADLGVTGLSSTEPHGALVADSACSATQLATGRPALSEAIGVDVHGHAVETVLERAQRTGRSVGLVTDTRITHATPAAFAAHLPHRSLENEIAEQLIAAGVDVLLSGGLRYFVPASVNDHGPMRDAWTARLDGAYTPESRRGDERDLVAEAEAAGYASAFDREGLGRAVESGQKVLGLFAASSMINAILFRAVRDDERRRQPGLEEMTAAALEALDRNPTGFFLMIEAGQIDWAGHANDAGWLLHEMLRFDATLEVVLEWLEGRDDTLVVVTADHETGGFGFSYSRVDIPEPVTIPGGVFEARPYAPNFNFIGFDVLDGLAAQSHTFERALAPIAAMSFGAARMPTAIDVANAINAVSVFKMTDEQAEAVLADEPNLQRIDGHPYLDGETFPAVCDFDAFYVYPDSTRSALVARALASAQGVVWSTGTHTSSPVPVFAVGPAHAARRFGGLLDHVEVGRALMLAVDPSWQPEAQ